MGGHTGTNYKTEAESNGGLIFIEYRKFYWEDFELVNVLDRADAPKQLDTLLPESVRRALVQNPAIKALARANGQAPGGVREIMATAPIDRWVYIYELTGGVAALQFELRAGAEGEAMGLVPWGDTSRKAYGPGRPRPVGQGMSLPERLLKPGREYLICLSEIQLPYARTSYYGSAAGLTALRARSTHVETSRDMARDAVITVHLVNYISVAREAGLAVQSAADAVKRFFAAPEAGKKQFLAQAVLGLAKHKEEIKDWTKQDLAEKFLKDRGAASKAFVGPLNARGAFLGAWMLLPGYDAARDDYGGGDEETQLLMIQQQGTFLNAAPGHRYGHETLKALSEDTWYSALLLGKYKRPLTTSAKVLMNPDVADLARHFISGRWLRRVALATDMAIEARDQIVVEVLNELTAIQKRCNFPTDGLVVENGQLFHYEIEKFYKTQIKKIRYHFASAEGHAIASPKFEQALSKVTLGAARLIAVVEFINLCNYVSKMGDLGKGGYDQTQNLFATAASLSKCVVQLNTLYGHLLKGSKPLLKSGVAWLVDHAMIVGTVVEIFRNTMSAADAFAHGEYGLGIGYGLVAVGTAVSIGWTGIGLVIVVVGVVLLWVFYKDELMLWATRCVWGTAPDPQDPSVQELQEQIDKLLRLVGLFQASAQVAKKSWISPTDSPTTPHSFVLTISLGMWDASSRIIVEFYPYLDNYKWSGNHPIVYATEIEKITWPDDPKCVVTFSDAGTPQKIVRDFDFDMPKADHASHPSVRAEFRIQLDFYGDGQLLVPTQPVYVHAQDWWGLGLHPQPNG